MHYCNLCKPAIIAPFHCRRLRVIFPFTVAVCHPISLLLSCMMSCEQGTCEPEQALSLTHSASLLLSLALWLSLVVSGSFWLSLWFTLSLSLIPADSVWFTLALSGAHWLTRSLLGSQCRCSVAAAYIALHLGCLVFLMSFFCYLSIYYSDCQGGINYGHAATTW